MSTSKRARRGKEPVNAETPPQPDLPVVTRDEVLHSLTAPKFFKEKYIKTYSREAKAIIDRYQLGFFRAETGQINLNWVREFYASGAANSTLPRHEQMVDQVVVRGVTIDISKEAISRVLKIPIPKACEYMPFVWRKRRDEAEEARRLIADSDAVWFRNKTYIKRPRLHQLSFFLNELIRHNIVPTTQVTEVNVQRALLIYCMLKGFDIDFPALINADVKRKFHAMGAKVQNQENKNQSTLYFATLFSTLCRHHGVPVLQGERMLPGGKRITDRDPVPQGAAEGRALAQQAKEGGSSASGPKKATIAGIMENVSSLRLEFAAEKRASRERDRVIRDRQAKAFLNMELQSAYQRQLCIAQDEAFLARASGERVKDYPMPPQYHQIPEPDDMEVEYDDDDLELSDEEEEDAEAEDFDESDD